MNFQNKEVREVKDITLLELLRNKENTLRVGAGNLFNPQIKINSSHEIESVSNSKAESIGESRA